MTALLLVLALGAQTDAPAEGLIRAGQTFPGAKVCQSAPHTLLMALAQQHAEYQASRRTQGHQKFQGRWDQINAAGLGSAAEICAESWPWQRDDTADELGHEMFHCWKQSAGHWSVASKKHRYFGAGMARGSNGVWYSCILVAD